MEYLSFSSITIGVLEPLTPSTLMSKIVHMVLIFIGMPRHLLASHAKVRHEVSNMSVVYGPVPSWRLGRSLGIDPILPPKTCTFDCVYCQLGHTVNKISVRLDVPPVDEERLKGELLKELEKIDVKSINVVTFSGCGEPTLNPRLGEMIRRVKDILPDVPVAVLTNSSLVCLKDVRKDLGEADIVVAKLDAADQKTFVSINRPADGIPPIKEIIRCLTEFKREFTGILSLQVMLVDSSIPMRTNISEDAINAIIDAIRAIEPDEVQVNTPTRPPSESYIKPVSRGIITCVVEMLESIGVREVLAIGIRERTPTFRSVLRVEAERIREEVFELLKRRPCRIVDITLALGLGGEIVRKAVEDLMRRGLIRKVEGVRGTYFIATTAKSGED